LAFPTLASSTNILTSWKPIADEATMEASSALLKDLEKEGYYLTEKGLASCLESASGKSEIRKHIHNVSRLSKFFC